MPFVRVKDGEPTDTAMTTVRLEHLEPRPWGLIFARVLWQQLETIGYVLPAGTPYPPSLRRSDAGWNPPTSWIAPRHDRPADERGPDEPTDTDLASVPPFLWGVFASFGRHTLPALIHDRLYWETDARADGDATERSRLHREADWLFRLGMREQSVPGPRRWVMWSAVRLFGHGLRLAGVVALVAAVATTTIIVPALRAAVATVTAGVDADQAGVIDAIGVVGDRLAPGSWSTWQLVVLVASALLAVVAGVVRDRSVPGAMVIAALAGPIVVPTVLVSLAATITLWLPAALTWVVAKLLHRPVARIDDPGRVPPIGAMNG